jgi:hypothetical protein
MMTTEQLLITGIGAVTSALMYVCKILWDDKKECKADRIALRQEIEDVKTKSGVLGGFTSAVGVCDKEGCKLAKVAREITVQLHASAKLLLLSLVLPAVLAGCGMPVRVGVCKDDVCVSVETRLPARKSGKEAAPVQP